MDLFAVDAADRVEARTAPDQLLFTPPPEDQEILDGIKDTADQLSTLLLEEIIPVYGDRTTISNEDRDLHEEMLPLRADAEQLASDLDQRRRGPGGRDAGRSRGADRPQRELLRELPRPCSSASRRARSSSRYCWGSSSRGR